LRLILPEVSLPLLSSVVSFVFVTLPFAMMFKWLPDAEVAWEDVWMGAAVTALLFELGKLLIGPTSASRASNRHSGRRRWLSC
jgi:membrane protein